MSPRSDDNPGSEPEYRVYRGGDGGARKGSTHAARTARGGQGTPDPAPGAPGDRQPRRRPRPQQPPAAEWSAQESSYRTYRSRPQSLVSRLRGETESDVGTRIEELERRPSRRTRSTPPPGGGTPGTGRGYGRGRFGRFTWRRALKYVVLALVCWLALSFVLFCISAEDHAGNIPKSLQQSLTSDSTPMLFSAQTVLILGLDNRPTTGYSSKEGGLTSADTTEADARTDTIMLWRVGGGVSRKLSIPRDTLVNVPGVGEAKINAAWAQSPGLTVKVIEQLTGIKINHVIIVDLGNFAKFIDDIGGVTVTTPKICSAISGGAKDGGYTLDLSAGSHHLSGTQALTLARTRDNSCNVAYTDIQREEMQQEIMNAIKSQLFSVHAFMHLPWASWDAPGAIQTDMGPLTLAQLFISSEIGGSPKPETLKETDSTYYGQDVLVPNAANVRAKVNQLMNG